jgi:hypothetical protein
MSWGRGFGEDAPVAEAPILQMGDREVRHVVRGGADRSVGGEVVEGERLSSVRAVLVVVAARLTGGQRRGDRLGGRAVPHAERGEDVVAYVLVVGLPAHLRHDVAGQPDPVVRVRRYPPRRTYPGRHVPGEIGAQGGHVGLGARGNADRAVLEAGGVVHQVLERDRPVVGRGDAERGQVFVHVCVQVQLPLLDLLHHGGPGEQLGDRGDPDLRGFRVERRAVFAVGQAVPLAEEDLAGADHRDHRPRHVIGRQGAGHLRVEEGRQLTGGQRVYRRHRHRRLGDRHLGDRRPGDRRPGDRRRHHERVGDDDRGGKGGARAAVSPPRGAEQMMSEWPHGVTPDVVEATRPQR